MMQGFQTSTNFSSMKETLAYKQKMDPEELQKSIINVIKKNVTFPKLTLNLEIDNEKLLRNSNSEHQGPSREGNQSEGGLSIRWSLWEDSDDAEM